MIGYEPHKLSGRGATMTAETASVRGHRVIHRGSYNGHSEYIVVAISVLGNAFTQASGPCDVVSLKVDEMSQNAGCNAQKT